MAYGGINVHKKQRQICLLTEAGARLAQRIPAPQEQGAAVCAERRPASCVSVDRERRGGKAMHTAFSLVLDRRRRMR